MKNPESFLVLEYRQSELLFSQAFFSVKFYSSHIYERIQSDRWEWWVTALGESPVTTLSLPDWR